MGAAASAPSCAPVDRSCTSASPLQGKRRFQLNGHTSFITVLQALPDGHLASGSKDGSIKRWDASHDGGGKLIATLEGHTGAVLSMCMLGKYLVSGGSDGTIRQWDLATNKQISSWTAHSKEVHSLVALTNGNLASGSDQGTVTIWDAAKGEQKSLIKAFDESGKVKGLAALPKGRVASSGASTAPFAIKVHDAATGTEEAVIETPDHKAACLLRLPTGLLASGSTGGFDATVRIWSVEKKALEHTLKGHKPKAEVRRLTMSGDGKLVSAGSDGEVRLWDIHSYAGVFVLDHTSEVFGLAAFPSGGIAAGGLMKSKAKAPGAAPAPAAAGEGAAAKGGEGGAPAAGGAGAAAGAAAAAPAPAAAGAAGADNFYIKVWE